MQKPLLCARAHPRPAEASVCAASGNAGIDGLMLMLDNVVERLQASGAATQTPRWWDRQNDAPRSGEPQCVEVAQCLADLRLLRTALRVECERLGGFEFEVHVAHAALTEARGAEIAARRLALRDSLTALPNRECFLGRLASLTANGAGGRAIAVLYIDLDAFKPVNDKHGHDTGDALLRIVATRLRRSVRAGDVVSRLGGDEFACLIVGAAGCGQLSELARKMHESVSAPVQIGKLSAVVRPSIGIAIWPGDGATPKALLKSADAAMYSAKQRRTDHAFAGECATAPQGPEPARARASTCRRCAYVRYRTTTTPSVADARSPSRASAAASAASPPVTTGNPRWQCVSIPTTTS